MKGVHWGKTPFRVNDHPEISKFDAEYDPESWVNLTPLFGQLTEFRVAFDPEWGFGPNGPLFRVRLTWVFFKCIDFTNL